MADMSTPTKPVIVGYNVKEEGLVLHLDRPARLRGLNAGSTSVFVPWDKIGMALFQEYEDGMDASELNSYRREYNRYGWEDQNT